MARTGLAYLRDELRLIAAAGTADYTAGTVVYFSDDYLDKCLDRNRTPFVFQVMESEPYVVAGGTYEYTVYEIEDRSNIEETTGGTAVFYIQDKDAVVVASTTYEIDYRNGIVTFGANTTGATYYATGYEYDLNGAASDIWRQKAAQEANSFDFSTSVHNIKGSQIAAQYNARADYYKGLSKKGAGGGGYMMRADT